MSFHIRLLEMAELLDDAPTMAQSIEKSDMPDSPSHSPFMEHAFVTVMPVS